ncbi:hypothetical protein FC70_GL000717 [Paucilactobacillus oligofermentans DSM 15707 = LMG 22743]|uniref:DUF1659 domain-containing protein n=1 Tax=Paucilactobacillus oligofermentans DSM 15707 = LMG 22743 TaxID=1423778 RepID=A0A0R1REV0_9LACO|nr:hypothetical protein [Paucilactobacillus oligofermentans]KRL55121.1 hypothetical protein FC70_GL000717 [Paucilactobacillus oligofermentans DSM 15707 = LMG 22743]CUS25891.1 Uncharacterized protein LACOL_0583 [Paucilactobacillus oligofermentans DSM 15707 = LMG 22743]
MIRTFKTAKVQLLMVGDGHEDGINRSFSHIDENATDDQIQKLGTILETITSDKFENAIVISSYRIDKK